jgi:hypothetical protein
MTSLDIGVTLIGDAEFYCALHRKSEALMKLSLLPALLALFLA